MYADLLGQKITQYQVKVWLINTGWTGGPYGLGHRILLPYTRALVKGVLTHHLDDVSYHQDECFGLWIPESCPGVPADILTPIKTWTDADAYRRQARVLVERFEKNFSQFLDAVPAAVAESGPHQL